MLEEYLRLRYLESPNAYIQDMPESERITIQGELREKLREQDLGANFPEGAKSSISGLLLKLSYFPEVLEEFIVRIRPTNTLVNGIVSANTETALRLLQTYYTEPLGEKIEVLLLSNPEAVFELLEWAWANKITLRYSLDAYIPSLYQDIGTAWRYLNRTRKIDEEEFFDIIREAYGKRSILTPQGALLAYIIDGGRPSAQVVLNPKTALAAAALTKNADYCGDWLVYPKWAYHALMFLGDSLGTEQKQTALQSLVRILPWTYQFMRDTHMKDRNNDIYQSYMSVAATKWQNILDYS